MLQDNVIPMKQINKFLMPSAFVGIGGYSKPIFPRLDTLFQEHYGFRPGPLPFVIFDFDEANAEVSLNGRRVSIKPYLVHLPKKTLKDAVRKLRKKNGKAIPFLEIFAGYVDLKKVRYIDAPGLNLAVQSGNLAFRLCWLSHVLPALNSKIRNLHPDPHTINDLQEQGLRVSNRSVIWVIAGGASTTGPCGLIPMLAQLRAIKPPETSLFALVFTPNAYRDKTEEHKSKGRAIFRSTLQQVVEIFNGKEFCQPYGTNGYQISLSEEPCDQIYLVDSTLNGGRTELKSEEMADLVARFLFRFTVGSVGEHVLGIIGNLNDGLKGGQL